MKMQYDAMRKGEEIAMSSRTELEALSEAATHMRSVADYWSGKVVGLTPDETRAFVAAPPPLAFWRKRRGLTQAALAASLGVAQNYLSDVENGKRSGPVELWLKLSRALDVPVEDLVDAE